eukprot:403364519
MQTPINKPCFNIAKMSTTLSHKLHDNNKVIRQEASQYFSSIQRIIGIRGYLNIVINLLENISHSKSKSSQYIDSILDLLISSVSKIKSRDDLDLHKFIECLDTLWEQDQSHTSKIQDVMHVISQTKYSAQEVMSEVRNLFNNTFHSQLEERLGIVKETYRRNGTKDSNSLQFQFNPEKSETQAIKKKQLLLPNINHIQSNSPLKPSIQSVNSSQQIKPTKQKNQSLTNEYQIMPSNQLYMQESKDQHMVTHQKHNQQQYQNQMMINSSKTVLNKQRFNSQSHQVLPQLSNIQKNPSIANNEQIKSISLQLRDQQKSPIEMMQVKNGHGEMGQVSVGKLKIDPTFFQQTNGSLTGSIDRFSTKTSNQPKPGSGFTTKSLKFMRGTVTSLGDASSTSGDAKQYLSIGELEPLVNYELEWKMFLTDIKSDNWSRQFESCNILRRACKFHIKEIVYSGGSKSQSQVIQKGTTETFHEINLQIVKLVDSLRSTVSKQAMITLYEMFESLPKALIEQDLEPIFQVLVKRSVDTNFFVAEEAEKTLMSMCRTVSETKMLSALLAQKTSKSSVIRCQICRCLCVIFIKLKQKQQTQSKQSNKLTDTERNSLSQIGIYMQDSAQEVRNQAKVSIRQIVNLFDEFSNRKDLKTQIMMSMGESHYNKVIEYIDNECV